MTTTGSPASRKETSMTMQYLSFQLAGEEFAFGILRVKEILEYDTLTRVPNAPPAVRGVINLRGAVIPVLDLAPDTIEPAPAFGSRVRVEYLVGMGKLDSRKFVLILDIDRLLGDVGA